MTLPADTQVTRLMVHDFEVPSNRTTTYICTWFKPPTDRKYHVYDMRLVRGLMTVVGLLIVVSAYMNQGRGLWLVTRQRLILVAGDVGGSR